VIIDPRAVVAVPHPSTQRDSLADETSDRVGRHRRRTPSITELVGHAIQSSAKTWRLAILLLTVAAVIAAVRAHVFLIPAWSRGNTTN
jgi:hypothetical protein